MSPIGDEVEAQTERVRFGGQASAKGWPALCGLQSTHPHEYAMRIAIASDHAAVAMKAELAAWLRETGHDVADLGTDGEASVDYPDYGYILADAVAQGEAEYGVALCGSGIGISIAANRHPAVRCALVSEPLSARLAREHNDANVIALGARLIGLDMAKACVEAFLTTEFAGGRHCARVEKLAHPRFHGANA